MKIAVSFFRVAAFSTLVISISYHPYMNYTASVIVSILLGLFLLGWIVFEVIDYRNNRKTPRLQNNEWKYTKIVHHAIPAFFLICVILNQSITTDKWQVYTVLRYGMWFSLGLLLSSFLVRYVIRKDMENIRKQIEQREKMRKKPSQKLTTDH